MLGRRTTIVSGHCGANDGQHQLPVPVTDDVGGTVMTMMQRAAVGTSEREANHGRNGPHNMVLQWEQLDGSATSRPRTRGRNFWRYLKTFGLITMVGVGAGLAMPEAKAQALLGGFSLTCHNLRLNSVNFSKTAVLTADCNRRDKSIHTGAQINLNDYVTNNHGRLQWSPGAGDFQQSCGGDFLYQSGVLTAFCRGGQQMGNPENPVPINLNDRIANDNGDLKYR
jgi:hypothetical protein